MKKILFICFMGISCFSHAQMVDLLSSMAVQGSLSAHGTEAAVQGIALSKQLRILQGIQDVAMQIKTSSFGNYRGVDKNAIMGNPLSSTNWELGSDQDNLFYIQLNQIDKQTCHYLSSHDVSAKNTLINGKENSSSCSNINTIKYIFD